MKTPLSAAINAMLTCATTTWAAGSELPALIPLPAQMEAQAGTFILTDQSSITFAPGGEAEGEKLAVTLRAATGFKLPVYPAAKPARTQEITLWLQTNQLEKLGAEGYTLSAASNNIVISAATEAGLFYGGRTLLQLLPPEISSSNAVPDFNWEIPCVAINDQPRFPWRGLMLDVSRHFFPKTEVKQLLDALALYKINTFHWHLADDHGWRIEIKQYPRLTSVGAWRSNIGFNLDPKSSAAYGADGRYGGFYTQDDIRDVVAYAQKLHITVIPEIEMPGHAVAALAAYPEYSCTGQAQSTDIGAGIHNGIYCAGKEAAFEFLQNVLTEVIALFPSKYIHIGGDEVPKGNWQTCALCQARMKAEGLANEEELQSYFIRRMEKFVSGHGRTLIGWSEILQGGLAQNAAVMDWIGGGREAASQGHDVVMTPSAYCYLDHYQDLDHAVEPRAIGGYLPLSQVYSFEPIPPRLAPEMQRHILGGQGNIWTEYIPNLKHVEYMAFPRLCALAEATWSPAQSRNFEDFTRRLKMDNRRLDLLGVNYRLDTAVQIGGWTPAQIHTTAATLEWDVTKAMIPAGIRRVSLNYTQGASGINIAWVALLEDGKEISRDTHRGFTGANPRQPVYTLNVPAPKAGASYTVRAEVTGSGGTDSTGIVSWDPTPVWR